MRLGICALLETAELLGDCHLDYLEGPVSQVLAPDVPDSEWEMTQRRVAALPFRMEALAGFIPGNIKTTGPDVDVARLDAYVSTALRRAGEIGIQTIVFGSGDSRHAPAGFPLEKALDQISEHLKRWGDPAARAGVTIVIEPLQPSECNIINSVAEGQRLVEMVNHPNIRLLADLYHMARIDESPEHLSQTNGLLAHVHMAEVAERKYPGYGRQDFRPYFRELKKIGYDSRISMECRWDDIVRDAPKALNYVREQLALCPTNLDYSQASSLRKNLG